ncbi:hypothetical protein WMF20_12485 [Sorangium sp. So ce834]|uniref:hypothetical protein n=1 Tax=Sorangium sp. So ce834 TaxID=3133321 RepID=UPI003F647ADE
MRTIAGKQFRVYGDGPAKTEADLRAQIRGLNLRDSLRAIAEAYAAVASARDRFVVIHDVPIPPTALAYIALLFILECSDEGSGHLNDRSLAALVDDYHNMTEAGLENDAVLEYLIRQGQAQFSFQHHDPYALPRFLVAFGEIWPARPRGRLPPDVVSEATGFNLEQLLLFGQSFAGMAKRQGYINPYPPPAADSSRPVLRLFSHEQQAAFLDRFSATYAQIRAEAFEPPSPALAKYRFNPLFLYPLIRPDISPPTDTPVFLVPCYQFLIERVTHGILFDCRKKFGPSFDEQFGFVAQEYVGKLLGEVFPEATIRPEFSYTINGKKYLSPDWLVLDGERAVVVEVKKSLLRSKAKAFGHSDSVKRDLEETLHAAKRQLCQFKSHLPHIKNMPRPENVELAAVFWEEASWVNSILQRDFGGEAGDDVVHAMSVRELERLVARSKASSLYDLLWAKRWVGEEARLMDVGDWMAHHAPPEEAENDFLVAARDRFFDKWELGDDNK